ncbi:MAG TPA: hypothetical protein VGW10_18825 [Solirubrobacteraceae bacterium]|nr:hypothetical protein [Solirubrobacteraceae bacterium]
MRRLLVLVSAVVLVDVAFYSAITPLLPYYTELLDLSKSEAGALAGAYAAGTLLLSLPAGCSPRGSGRGARYSAGSRC